MRTERATEGWTGRVDAAAPSLHAMRLIVVLGMHRSGTSALTRALAALGAALGPLGQLHQNSENVALRAVNERLLDIGGGTWDAPPARGWLEAPAARAAVVQARETVAEQLGPADPVTRNGPVAWKDPRTSVTVPFWLDVLDGDAVFVLVHRHPGEVAASLGVRSSLGRGHSHALWERYNADALTDLAGRPTYIQPYSQLVAEPEVSLASLHGALQRFGVALPVHPSTAEHGLAAAQRHHRAAAQEAVDADVATASQQELLGVLGELAGAHDALSLPRPLLAPHPLSVEVLDLARRVRMDRRLRRAARASRSGAGSPGGSAGGSAGGSPGGSPGESAGGSPGGSAGGSAGGPA